MISGWWLTSEIDLPFRLIGNDHYPWTGLRKRMTAFFNRAHIGMWFSLGWMSRHFVFSEQIADFVRFDWYLAANHSQKSLNMLDKMRHFFFLAMWLGYYNQLAFSLHGSNDRARAEKRSPWDGATKRGLCSLAADGICTNKTVALRIGHPIQRFSLAHLIFQCHTTITGWWFGTFFIFPYIGNVIIPTDELHNFSEG